LRKLSLTGVGGAARRHDLTEAPLAASEVGQCLLEIGQGELRPQARAEMQLRISQIPQQKIADALLPARADEQIRLRQPGERELGSEILLGDVLGAHAAAGAVARCFLRRLDDVPAAAVAHRHLELQPRVGGGTGFGGGDARLQAYPEVAALADEAHAHGFLVQLIDLAVERLDKQTHEAADFLCRPSPVLAREGEQRERLDTAL